MKRLLPAIALLSASLASGGDEAPPPLTRKQSVEYVQGKTTKELIDLLGDKNFNLRDAAHDGLLTDNVRRIRHSGMHDLHFPSLPLFEPALERDRRLASIVEILDAAELREHMHRQTMFKIPRHWTKDEPPDVRTFLRTLHGSTKQPISTLPWSEVLLSEPVSPDCLRDQTFWKALTGMKSKSGLSALAHQAYGTLSVTQDPWPRRRYAFDGSLAANIDPQSSHHSLFLHVEIEPKFAVCGRRDERAEVELPDGTRMTLAQRKTERAGLVSWNVSGVPRPEQGVTLIMTVTVSARENKAHNFKDLEKGIIFSREEYTIKAKSLKNPFTSDWSTALSVEPDFDRLKDETKLSLGWTLYDENNIPLNPLDQEAGAKKYTYRTPVRPGRLEIYEPGRVTEDTFTFRFENVHFPTKTPTWEEIQTYPLDLPRIDTPQE